MNDTSAVQKAALQKRPPGAGHTFVPSRQPYTSKPFASRHVCFYKSGDAQFSGLPVVINNRTFKTFEALLDSLSKRIPLPFGVRTITTPRGHTAVRALDELHHGHSYICSDKRIVKPIDLEQARHRPPPWYHTRPVSIRRPRERLSPHPRNTGRTEHATLLHTPKRLVVFRNGDPEVKHTLLLHKRSTQSFKALFYHISETMRFPVRRLHTTDGRRVDGLPALILCSGVLVAAGPEPFRKGNYDVQKAFAPTWLPAKSVGRLNPVTQKKKSKTSSTKSLPFSPSSERYIVNQLHNSFAESTYDNTGSLEMGTGHLLESVAETDTVTGMDGDMNEYICMPKDDDIEKSFRVNQDGSMTVEMKVRLTVKEEETVHWTTTLSRQNVTSQMNSGLESHSDLGAALADKIAPDVDTDAPAIQRWPEEYSNVSTNECLKKLYEKSTKIEEPLKLLPEQKLISVKTESQETVTNVDTSTEKANSEQEHCLLSAPGKCNRHPVPKPRSGDISQLKAGMYKSAEVLQLHDSGQQTVLHIFQQQTCQKSFCANTEFFTQEPPTCDAVFSASSNTVPTSSKDLEYMYRPATVYSSFEKQENVLPLLELQTSCERTKPKMHTPLTETFKISPSKMISTADNSKKKKKVRVVVKKNHIVHIMTHESIGNKIDILKKRKKIRAVTCNQAGEKNSMSEQYRTKLIKKLLKSKRTNIPKTVQMQIQSLDELCVKEHCTNIKHPAKTNIYQGKQTEHFTLQSKDLLNVSTNKGSLIRQTSIQGEHETQKQDTQDLKESTFLPALHYSSSVLNDYVELRLQRSETEPPPDQEQLLLSKPSQELVITWETPGAELASKKKIPPHNPLDKLSVKESLNISPKRSSAHEGSSLSPSNTLNREIKSSQSNPSVNIPLPMTRSLRNNHWEKMSLGDNLSPDENSVCKTIDNSISQDNTQLTSYAVLDYSLATCKKISLKQEIIQSPQSVKKDKNADEPLGNALRCANFRVKPTSLPGEPSLEKTLSTQHSIEQIPKNNTLSKASLFRNQDTEKTVLSKNATFYKMTKSRLSGMINKSITQGLVGSCENSKHASSRSLSEKEVLPAVKSYTVKMAVRPDMRHVLDELCHSIHSLREATQHKQLFCLEKSNSMPDFSSHLSSTFGSSSRVFLAFLSVMTLRNGLENLNALHQAENRLSCSEALLMLQSLEEMAAIEDAEKLKADLNALQKSVSDQLLQSWKGFQHLSETCMSSHVISECNRGGSYSVSSSEEEAVQGLMEELGVPDRVREELAAFHTQTTENVRCNQVETSEELCKSLPEKMVNQASSLSEDKFRFPDCVLKDIHTYVKCIIEKAVSAHIHSEVFASHLLLDTEKEIKIVSCEQERNSFPKDSNIYNNVFKEKQQGIKEKDIMNKGKQKTYAKQEININEMKDSAVCELSGVKQRPVISKDDCVEEDYIMETHSIYSAKEIEKMEDRRDTSEIDMDRITEVYPKLSESRNGKEDLTISEKEKSSLEVDSEDNEHANFLEDLVSDKKENLQINSQIDPQAKWQNKGLVTQAHTQLNHKTESVKKTGQLKMQNTLLAVCVEHGTQDQTKKIYSMMQQVVVEVPEPVNLENIDDQMKWSPKEAVVCERKTVQSKKKNGSVAKLINNLETCAQRPSTKPVKAVHRLVGHTDVSASDILHNISSTGKLKDTTLEANSSSLAFSYDSQSSPVTQESERIIQANRVKFIRDMFLAKSQTGTQTGQRQLHSPNSDLSDSQPESTDSGGHWSKETSSGEDDASRLAIAKGFVRRTIERLYGRSNSSSTGAENIRSPSALKAKQREVPERINVSSLASDHEARTRETDLSYFSATYNTSDIFNVPTDCVTLNKQVQCEDANSIDTEHWLFVENLIDESSSKLKDSQRNGNNQSVPVEPEQQSGREDFFHETQLSTKLKKCPGSPGSKFTYFNLPNASDSELEPEEKMEMKVAPETQAHRTMAERNSFLLAFSPPVLKKADNKVHPLMDSATPTVVNQPVKGQSAQTEVIKQSAEPDALEMLFVFCGQHCPIL